MKLTMLNIAAVALNKTECEVLQGFIDDNRDIAFTFMVKGYQNTCDDMVDFVVDNKLETSLYIYCDIVKQMKQ